AMSGDVTLDGQRIDLKQLVSTGRAAPSGGSYAFPIPRGASARVKYDDVTFHINSVNPGAIVAGRGATDWPFWMFAGGTGVVAAAVWMILRSMPEDMLGFDFDSDANDNRFARYMYQPDETKEEEPPPEEEVDDSDEKAGGDGQRHKGEEGKMGKPT